jgi:hypothetical protein
MADDNQSRESDAQYRPRVTAKRESTIWGVDFVTMKEHERDEARQTQLAWALSGVSDI